MSEKNKELILFADDDRLLRILTEELLLEFGYRVLIATNGEEAVNLYEQHRNEISLAILDITMPKIDGLAAASKMQLLNNQLPVIFITGKGSNESLEASREIKNSVVLNKPYTPEKLSETIRKALD